MPKEICPIKGRKESKTPKCQRRFAQEWTQKKFSRRIEHTEKQAQIQLEKFEFAKGDLSQSIVRAYIVLKGFEDNFFILRKPNLNCQRRVAPECSQMIN